jgi:hypothetical protein
MSELQFTVAVIRRPGWSSRSTWFGRVTNHNTGETYDCAHCHRHRELAARCALQIIDELVDIEFALDSI